MQSLWAGVDVGGRRKGFHVAVIDDATVVSIERAATAGTVASSLAEIGVTLAAIDSPLSPAPDGDTSRSGERELVRARVCNIRWTPDRERLAANPAYYEWIEHGFELYAALAAVGVDAIECFPTASWSRWAGPRGPEPRTAWSARALSATGISLPARRLSQDERDAIGAALTARAHAHGETEAFGDIMVPVTRPSTTSGPRRTLAEIVAEVAAEIAAAGRPLPVPPDIEAHDDRAFWEEVERRYEREGA